MFPIRLLLNSILLFLISASSSFANKQNVCKSIEIKTVRDFEDLRDCDIVVGHVSILNVRLTNPTHLVSTLQEITDYLLIYRVEGLKSLEEIFPNLVIIRGKELLFEKYSLIVYENRDLVNLGLIALLRIQNGSIRIEANPILCFVDTVNWVYLMNNATVQHFSLRSNKSPNDCPVCLENEIHFRNEVFSKHCWNLKSFQRKTPQLYTPKCPEKCQANGCDFEENCCDPSCLTACSSVGCAICSDLIQNGTCTKTCNIPFYQLNKRECLTDQECRSNARIPHGGVCIEKCPQNYENVVERGISVCKLLCNGTFILHSKKDLLQLEDCSSIKGSLIIELIESKSSIIMELERALRNIQEISGYLKVTRSPQLLSLSFLHNLDTIKGNELIDGKYGLYVVDNYHLEQIWAANQKVVLLKGHVYFHLNPKLCYENIIRLESAIKTSTKISIMDASPNSNGERVICGDAIRTLNAEVEDLNSTAARIKVNPMSSSDKEVLLGYLHHFKESPVKNVTMYDGRHGCGHDNWRMDLSLNRNVRHVISHLKPFTQYAYFVKTLTMNEYHNPINAYSPIQYFTTLPGKPGPVEMIYYHSISPTEVVIHWWPPRNPNGIITKYIISYEQTEQNETTKAVNHNAFRQKFETNLSNCLFSINPENSGPTPVDENFYNKERITYEEALANFIYVPAPRPRSPPPKQDEKEMLNAEIDFKEIEKTLKKHHDEMEKKAFLEQDTGINNFVILKPQKICSISSPSVQYQVENSCKALEQFKGIEIPGHVHMFSLKNLQRETWYKISVRACVHGLENGCGLEKTILYLTFSKRMEKFYKEFKEQT